MCSPRLKTFFQNFVHLCYNSNSHSAYMTCGVSQGSVLSPLLFLICINDVPACVKSSVQHFADDCVIYRNITNHTGLQSLQTDLKQF